jgi:RND family efflux transporter MFP subunit
VTVILPEQREVRDEQFFNGWTAAVDEVAVQARVRGHLERIHFADGDIVKVGDPLFTLDTRPFIADADAAKARRRALQAQLVAARREMERLQELLGKGGASQKQVEKQQADVAALDAQIAATGSEIERLELDVGYARILAPIAGRTSRALLSAGNLVDAGGADPVLTTIVSVDPIQVYFDVPESSLLKYRSESHAADPGRLTTPLAARQVPFAFGLESDEGYPRTGTLDFAENVVDATTGTLRLRGVAPNPDGFLVPGARVAVRLTVGEATQALVVPDRALLADQSLRYVLVAGPDDKVLRRDVRPGRLLEDGMRVLLPLAAAAAAADGARAGAGVEPTDRVLVEGQARARLNEPVEALDADGKPVPAPGAPAAKPAAQEPPAGP